MTNLSFVLASTDNSHDSIALDDMGDGALVLTERLEDGKVSRVALSFEQLEAAYSALVGRYGITQALAA